MISEALKCNSTLIALGLGGDEKEENEIREHISNLSVMIKKLRRDIVICDRIEKQKPVIDERIEQARESNSRKELMNYERIR